MTFQINHENSTGKFHVCTDIERIYSNGNNLDLLSNRYWKNAHELSTEAIQMKMTLGLEKDYIFFVTTQAMARLLYVCNWNKSCKLTIYIGQQKVLEVSFVSFSTITVRGFKQNPKLNRKTMYRSQCLQNLKIKVPQSVTLSP